MDKETKLACKELIVSLLELGYHVMFLLGLVFALVLLIKNFF